MAAPDQAALLESARQSAPLITALDMLKDPYVLEFLDLPQTPQLHENQLEQAIIDKLQHFLLELGRGFSGADRKPNGLIMMQKFEAHSPLAQSADRMANPASF